jgi:ABC-type Fe3+/spermidine/putrescine transport system ATPase subunit
VLHDGRLAQVGEPADVYAQPTDLHVAQLTGVARVIAVQYNGPDSDHYLETPVGTVVIRSPGTPQASEGDRTTWSLLRCWRM